MLKRSCASLIGGCAALNPTRVFTSKSIDLLDFFPLMVYLQCIASKVAVVAGKTGWKCAGRPLVWMYERPQR
jgi:hypothetical protein